LKVRAEWGRIRACKRDMTMIASYWRDRATASRPDRPGPAPAQALDDRTWDDLNMDDVFSVLDRAESVVGQQGLYARLRSSPTGAHLAEFEALVTRFTDDVPAR